MTAAERAHDPGPGWRKATAYDKPLPSTYIKVIAGSTQQFWVPDGERGLVPGDPVRFASAWGDQGEGVVRVVQPNQVLVAIEASAIRGAYEQWFSATDITRISDDEEPHE